MTEEQKRPFVAKAAYRGKLAKAHDALEHQDIQSIREGPWNVSFRDGCFIVHPDVMRDEYAGKTMSGRICMGHDVQGQDTGDPSIPSESAV